MSFTDRARNVQSDGTLPQDIMPLKRLREKARKDIGGSIEFLEASADNRLEPQDI